MEAHSAHLAQERELVFPFQQSELFYLLLPASSRLMPGSSRRTHLSSSISGETFFKFGERERGIADAFVQQAHYFSAPISIGRRLCPLRAAAAAGHIIGHCVRRRCIVACGSVSTCRKNATFP